MNMLPQTPYNRNRRVPHETINDLPVHPYTTQQIFWPTSESHQFTREDASRVFNETLLAADKRIPHPHMIEKSSLEAKDGRAEVIRQDIQAKQEERDRARKAKSEEEVGVDVIPKLRYDFKVKNVSVHWAGHDGRGRKGVGYRYGMPFDDRKRGLIKIPTKVD